MYNEHEEALVWLDPQTSELFNTFIWKIQITKWAELQDSRELLARHTWNETSAHIGSEFIINTPWAGHEDQSIS